MVGREARSKLQAVLAFAAAALGLWTLVVMGQQLMSGFPLDIGSSINHPTPRYGRFLALWMFFGSASAACLGFGLARLRAGDRVLRWLEEAAAEDERSEKSGAIRRTLLLVGIGTVLGIALPVLIRIFVLHGVALTDDEAAYRFAAQLLAGGRLAVDSPPFKLFFDNPFLVNDGRLYAGYFLGWPALLAPGVWLGVPGFMNAFYGGLVVPPLFMVLRRLLGEGWAPVGVVLYLVSPMLMVGAATELSHTTCVCALAWLTWLVLRAGDDGSPLWSQAGVAVAFALAFFVRPTAALAIGGPLVVWWAWGVLRRAPERRWSALAAFLPPAIVGAGLFFLVNWLLNGSPFTTGYARVEAYAVQNEGRFVQLPPPLVASLAERLQHAVAVTGSALFRLDTDLFGWPFSLLFVPFARRSGVWGVFLVGAVADLLLHAWILPDVGIDSFAPMHFFEMSWPLLLLTVAGIARLTRLARTLGHRLEERGARLERWPLSLATGLVIVTAVVFLPIRLGALANVTRNIDLPFARLKSAALGSAVVFAPEPFVEYCRGPGRGWVYHRPNNDPDLTNDPLWVNDLGVEADRLFMTRYPQRRGWIMKWVKSCDVVFLPLDRFEKGEAPADPSGEAGPVEEGRVRRPFRRDRGAAPVASGKPGG